MTDWNKPDLSDTYSNYQTYVKDRDLSVLKMLDGTTDTNLPSGAKRYNSSTDKFQKWDGASWSNLPFHTAIDNHIANTSIHEGRLPGEIIAYGGSSAPNSNWMICDGTAISRTTYAALFAVIGTSYGAGDGTTTFNIPDLRQRFPLGKAASGTGGTLGGTGGSIDHTHSVPAHYHGMGTGADLNITSSGTHTTAIDHDHGAFTSGGGSPHNHGVTDPGHGHTFSKRNNTTTPLTTGTPASSSGSGSDVSTSVTTEVTGISINNESAHTHSIDVPALTANSASTGAHVHASGTFAGKVGLVTGGVDGNAAMTSGTNNPPFQVVNYLIHI